MVVRAVKRGAGLPISNGGARTAGVRSRTVSFIAVPRGTVAVGGEPGGDRVGIEAEAPGQSEQIRVSVVFEGAAQHREIEGARAAAAVGDDPSRRLVDRLLEAPNVVVGHPGAGH